LVRDLADVLMEDVVGTRDFIFSNHITTVVAIVPKEGQKLFLE